MNENNACPCGSGKSLEACCGPYIDATAKAPTAEAVMRSRYTAFTLQAIDYLQDTLSPAQLQDFDKAATAKWAHEATWKGLEIIDTSAGKESDKEGTVEFRARFEQAGVQQEHHEVSWFQKTDGRWLYNGGKEVGPAQFKRETPKTGRNEPCPCGSGKKYKKCCGR